MGSCITLYYKITIDQVQQIIIIKNIKLCFCFNKTKKVQIDQVVKVIVQTDHSMVYRINQATYFSFKIIFELGDGSNFIGCAGSINKNNESQKAMNIIRSALPQHIYFEGDLVYN